MFPCLYALVMEVFSGLMDNVSSHPDFRINWRCKKTKLSHSPMTDLFSLEVMLVMLL